MSARERSLFNFLFYGFSAGPRWMCPNNCGRHYKYKGDLQRHFTKECGVKRQYLCKICSKAFKRKDSLKEHCILVHKFLFLKSVKL